MPQSYAPQYNTRFARELPRNLIELVKAQQTAAIALIFAETGIALAPYIEFNRSVHKVVHVPCFTAYKRGVGSINDSEGQYVESVAEFGLVSTCEGKDEDEAQDLVELYAQMSDSMARSAAFNDFYANLPYAVETADIIEHKYYPSVSVGNAFRQAVELILRIKLLEA